MNIIFFIIFTVAVFHGAHKVCLGVDSLTEDLWDADYINEPCKYRTKMEKYTSFVKRHILKVNFSRTNKQEWKRYLEQKKLCGRVPVQSFIDAEEAEVKKVCQHAGRRVTGANGNQGNLCISETEMDVYHVFTQEKTCEVKRVKLAKHKVVLACDKVQSQCLPVHYERYTHQNPGNLPCLKSSE